MPKRACALPMSAILSADDLNDFISPGVACIKPVETLPAAPPSVDPSSPEHEVVFGGEQQPAASGHAAPAQISLTDCLACSGCVTSAEAVLVSLQSHTEVLSTLEAAPALRLLGPDAEGKYTVDGLEDESRKFFVASVSPQSRANLAATCGRGATEKLAGQMIEDLLMGDQGLRSGGTWGNGFTWVLDTNTAREACLVLGSDEVLGSAISPCTRPTAPILTSSCPGWVCYAEKTHPYVLPHLSRVKSPQALMGTLLKTTLSRKLGIAPDRIWHLAIMPCFDKKLEASRQELTDASWAADGKGQPGRGVRDVDCVVTSKEILMLAESRGIDFFGLGRSVVARPQPSFPDPCLDQFLFREGRRSRQPRSAGTSGGNLHFILRDVQSRHASSIIHTARGRNADVIEYSVVSKSGEILFKAARYYGFRNIQNLVRRLKPAKPSRMPGGKPVGSARRPLGKPAGLEYGYVEAMACPGGCTNGGGQVKMDDQVVKDRRGLAADPGPQGQKDWLAEVDEAYFSDDAEPGFGGEAATANGHASDVIDGVSPSRIRDVLLHWSSVTGIGLERLAYTTFREVISDVGKDQTTDTQRVVQLASKIGGGW